MQEFSFLLPTIPTSLSSTLDEIDFYCLNAALTVIPMDISPWGILIRYKHRTGYIPA